MTVHVLADVAIGDVEQFLQVFTTAGADKRKNHGCLWAQAYAPVDESGRVLVLLAWPDLASFEAFRSDPEVGPTMAEGSAKGPPTFTVLEQLADLDA